MSWFGKKSTKKEDPVVQAVDQLAQARQSRRAALKDLLSKLDQIPVDDGLEVVGKELARVPKEGS